MPKSIAIAGKGGTGKTTVAALIIRHLCRAGQGPVLAVDADPDANLGTLLGITPEKTVGDLREDILREIRNFPAGLSKAEYVQAGLHRIIEEAEGFDLISMGRGEGPGCYCSLNNLIRKFSEDLAPSYRWVVIDNEAGLEHLSRRTAFKTDILLTVVSANPISIDTAKRIAAIADSLGNGIGRRYVLSCAVRQDLAAGYQKRIQDLQAEYLGNVPYDPVLEKALFDEGTLKGLQDSQAQEYIDSIMQRIR